MGERFVKLSTDFKFDFDIDQLISRFDGDRIDPSATTPYGHRYYSDPSGIPHWQLFSGSNARFSRNFALNFPEHCDSIARQLVELQRNIKKSGSVESPLVLAFLNHKIEANKVGLLKQQSGVTINPHVDNARTISLNIGIKNSNTATTYVRGSPDTEDFYSGDLERYTMNDGDVYLLRTQYAHAVKSLVTDRSDRDRTIITYTLVSR